jgi:hypothetical protein
VNVIDIFPQLGNLKDMTFIGWWVLFFTFSLVQISPIKINPWTTILRWIGNALTGDLRKDLNSLITDFRRQTIVTFARECRKDVEHSAEEWGHVLEVAEEYEAYCEKHNIKNGRIRQDTKYIRDLYQEMSRSHRIK